MALSDIASPFVWGSGGSRLTPEQAADQLKVAQALLKSGGDYSPIASPWQGAARLSQALFGGLQAHDAKEANDQNAADSASTLQALLAANGGAPAAAPSASAPMATPPMGSTAIPSGTIDPAIASAISTVAPAQGVDPAYLTRLAYVENGGKVDGTSPLSSATGPFQFIKSTAQQYGLANPSDPAAATDAAARLTNDNKAALTQALGREPTLGELYLAHQQGAAGAAKLLANPDAPVESVIGAQAAANNGAAPGMTAGQFANKWTGKFSDIGAAPNAAATATPAAARPAINPAILQAIASPYVDQTTKSIATMMFKSQMDQQAKAADPMRSLQMEKLRADIDKTKGKAGTTEYGLNPIYGTDENGKPVLGTLGKDGSFKKIDTSGVNISTGVDKIDLGTQFAVYDKKSGQLIGYQPKDLRGAEREKGIGEAQGKAVAAAPGDIQAGQNALDILGKIRTNPYLERGTGFSSILNSVPGTGGHDFSNMVEQAKSGAFLQAIQQMRGLGSLSNSEGGAATAAVTRMNTSTSKEAFIDALNDYEKIVNQGISRAQSRLANPSATTPSDTSTTSKRRKFNPATGMLE